MKNVNRFKEVRDRGGAYLFPQQHSDGAFPASGPNITDTERSSLPSQACHRGGVGQTTVSNNSTAERVVWMDEI